jgi:hypothetical protein
VFTISRTSGVLTNRTNLQAQEGSKSNLTPETAGYIESSTDLSRVPLLNHAAQRSSCNRMAGGGGCAAACSSAARKCATNGFTDPDAIFSVRPLPDTTSSHLHRNQNAPHLAHRNRTNPSKR